MRKGLGFDKRHCLGFPALHPPTQDPIITTPRPTRALCLAHAPHGAPVHGAHALQRVVASDPMLLQTSEILAAPISLNVHPTAGPPADRTACLPH